MSDYPPAAEARAAESHGINASDVKPGMIVWNAYGGSRGRLEVASEVRERADGNVEFDVADGRTGLFRPGFRLRLDRAAMERAAADREAAARQEREPRPVAIPRAHMARVIRDLDVPGYTEPEADREAGG